MIIKKALAIFGVLAVIWAFVITALHKDWAAAGTIAAVVAVVVAIYQASLSRMTIAADLIVKFEDRFETEEFLEKRKRATRALRAAPTKETKGDIEEILDFFETIGLLVRKNALDAELAWSSFFYWLHGYWRFAESFIREQQKAYPTRYQEMAWLHSKLLNIEKKKGGTDETEWDGFLDEEANESK